MLPYPHIDPVIVSLGPLKIRWYGLMYVLGFLATWFLVRYQARQHRWEALLTRLDNLNMWLIIGVILGGRLGYVFFYNPGYYLKHPLDIVATWQGGMSFHGGCLGVILAGILFCRRYGLDFWKTADLYVVTVPIGLGLGRLGNFINGELFGRVTDVPWAMIFPGGGEAPRHPSQLYELFLEGVVLFLILWSCRNMPWKPGGRKSWPHGSLLALFLVCYGAFRIFVELYREPDPQVGTLAFSLTMGQVLSLAMILAGILLWFLRSSAASKTTRTKRLRPR